jgi:hypothetical protein
MTTIDPAAPRGRILLVEDDFEAASFVIQVLAARNGFEVVHTADPAAAAQRRADPRARTADHGPPARPPAAGRCRRTAALRLTRAAGRSGCPPA